MSKLNKERLEEIGRTVDAVFSGVEREWNRRLERKKERSHLRVKSFLQDQHSRTITVVLECHEPSPEVATHLHNLVISEKPVRVVEEK